MRRRTWLESDIVMRMLGRVSFMIAAFLFFPANSYSAVVDVRIVNFSFVPETVAVNVGDTVRWTNNDGAVHSTTGGTNCQPSHELWDSGLLSEGGTFTYTFNSPGTFPYFSKIQCFTGTVVVNSPAPSLPVPTSPQSFPPFAVQAPEPNPDPSLSKPMGLGLIAAGENAVDVAITTGTFAGNVDVYFGIAAPALSPDIFLLTPTGFQFLSQIGLVPWQSTVNSATMDFGSMPVSAFPPGTYTLYLAATPPNSVSAFYLWQTSFSIGSPLP
jgi:plastocyanin